MCHIVLSQEKTKEKVPVDVKVCVTHPALATVLIVPPVAMAVEPG